MALQTDVTMLLSLSLLRLHFLRIVLVLLLLTGLPCSSSWALLPRMTRARTNAAPCSRILQAKTYNDVTLRMTAINGEEVGEIVDSSAIMDTTMIGDKEPVSSPFIVDQEVEGIERPTGKDATELWKLRLITREDPYSLHKWFSIVSTLSGLYILGVGCYQALLGGPGVEFGNNQLPLSLEIPTYIFFVSTTLNCLASVRMAFVHRKFDVTARNGFLGVASSTLFSVFYMLWTSPFEAGMVFNDQFINRLCFGIFVVLNTYFIGDTFSKNEEVVQGRRDMKAEEYTGRFVIDTFLYTLIPVVAALPAVLVTAYIQSVMHDRPWYFAQTQIIYDTTGVPFLPHGYYCQVLGAIAASVGALMVTLRDKKLINKTAEWVGISIFSVPALVYTVYVGYVFIQSMIQTSM